MILTEATGYLLKTALRRGSIVSKKLSPIDSGVVYLEGYRLIDDAVSAGMQVESYFVTHKERAALEADASKCETFEKLLACEPRGAWQHGGGSSGSSGSSGVAYGQTGFVVDDKSMKMMSSTTFPPGISAIVSLPRHLVPSGDGLVVLCDQVRDPTNLGTLMRSCLAFGANGLLLTEGCCDPWGAKAVRGGMGAQFKLPMAPYLRPAQVEDFVGRLAGRPRIVLCDLVRAGDAGGAATSLHDYDFRAHERHVLVLSSEAHGPSAWMRKLADDTVSVPISAAQESLNVATAGAIVLYEAAKQKAAR